MNYVFIGAIEKNDDFKNTIIHLVLFNRQSDRAIIDKTVNSNNN